MNIQLVVLSYLKETTYRDLAERIQKENPQISSFDIREAIWALLDSGLIELTDDRMIRVK